MKIGLADHFNYKKLIRFTLPTIIMMIFTSIYGVVDGLFISNVVGSTAFASINLIYPVIMIVGSIGFMVGTGGSAIISQTLGEGEKEKANKIFSMLIYSVIIVAIIVAGILIAILPSIAKLIGADSDMLTYSVTYGRILLCFIPCFMLQNCFQNFLIVAEKPNLGLVVTVLAGITNMILDFLFIYVFKFGIVGAALATGVSQFMGAIIPLIFFVCKNKTCFRLCKTNFDFKTILGTCGNGSSEMVSCVSSSLVNMLFNLQLMKYFGESGVVAYGIIMYVGFIFAGVYIGYSIGVAPIIGYHYGAENFDELKNLFKRSFKLLAFLSIILTSLAEISSPLLAKIFVNYDADLLSLTTTAIRLYCLCYLICAYNMFTSSLFTALGNGKISAIVSFLRTLVFQVGAIFLIPIVFGSTGLWLSVLISDTLAFMVSIFCLFRYKNKYQYI